MGLAERLRELRAEEDLLGWKVDAVTVGSLHHALRDRIVAEAVPM
jgi:predicted nucleotidyltransferase